MRKAILTESVFLWGLHAILAIAAVIPVLLALPYSADYGFFYVPFASWFVFGLGGLILVLSGLSLYFRIRLRKASQQPTGFNVRPTERDIPAVYGHECLDRAEFLPIIQSLFRQVSGVRYIRLEPLPGGHGGNTTVLVRLQHETDSSTLSRSFVVKLGERREMADEHENFQEYVRWRLTRGATLFGYAEWEDWAGAAYEFVGVDPDHEIQSLHQFYGGHAAVEVSELVRETYARLHRDWYRDGETEAVDLYHEYDLLSRKERTIVEQVGELAHDDDPYRRNFTVVEEKLQPNLKPRFCPEVDIPWHDPVAFLRTWPQSSLVVPIYRSIVHGDLNARNLLIEIGESGQRLSWFIDFSHTGNGLSRVRTREAVQEGVLEGQTRGHTLRDFCRLEADVKFILTRLFSESDLSLAVGFEKVLLNPEVVGRDVSVASASIEALRDGRFKKAWQVIKEIRARAADYLINGDDWRPYWLGLLHATLPVVYYHPDQFETATCERQQKRYALISAGMLCSQL